MEQVCGLKDQIMLAERWTQSENDKVTAAPGEAGKHRRPSRDVGDQRLKLSAAGRWRLLTFT